MHGLFQVAPNHACRCWKPIPAEIVGCFSLQDLHTGGPACLFHFCAVPFHPGQTSFLGSSSKNITAPTYLLHGQNMVYGVWSFPIRDSWQWVHKSLLMDWWWEIIHHGTGTCPWNRGVGGPLAPPKNGWFSGGELFIEGCPAYRLWFWHGHRLCDCNLRALQHNPDVCSCRSWMDGILIYIHHSNHLFM